MPPSSDTRRAPSLALWLFIATFVATTLAVGLATAWLDRLAQRQAREEALVYLRTNADALRDALDRGMGQHVAQVRAIASLHDVSDMQDPVRARAALDAFRHSFPQYAWLGLTDARGRVLAAADGLLEGVDVSGRPWCRAASSDREYVGDVHEAVLLAKLLPRQAEPWRFVDIAMPIHAPNGHLRGVLGAHLSWSWAAEVRQALSDGAVAERGADALVLDAAGRVLLGPADLQGRSFDAAAAAATHLVASARSTGHDDFHGLGWTVVVRQPLASALAPARELRAHMIGAALLVCLLSAPLLGWMARRLAWPMRRLAEERDAGVPVGAAAPAAGGLVDYREAALLRRALRRHDARQAEMAARLRDMADGLERRVAERTTELATANQALARTVGELDRSRGRVHEILAQLPAMVGHFDVDHRCLFANDLALRSHGLTREEALGRRFEDMIGPEAAASHAPHLAAALRGERVRFEASLTRAGRTFHYQASVMPEIDASGAVAGFYVMTYDVTALQEAREELQRGQRRLRAITDNLPVLIMYIDDALKVRFANRTLEAWTGVPVDAALDRPLREVVGEALYAPRAEPLARALAGERVEFEIESEAAGVRRHLHATYVPDLTGVGRAQGVYALSMDVTALREAERRMAELALSDALTGLPNRRRFDERLPEALARGRRQGTTTALFFLDVDRFKAINDTRGHAAGDAVLVHVGRRIAEAVRGTDFVARLAGDEFVVVLEGLNDTGEADLVAEKIVQAVRAPLALGEGPAAAVLQVTTSIGIACAGPGVDVAPEALLHLADAALYDTKRRGRDGHSRRDAGVRAAA